MSGKLLKCQKKTAGGGSDRYGDGNSDHASSTGWEGWGGEDGNRWAIGGSRGGRRAGGSDLLGEGGESMSCMSEVLP